MKYILSIVIPTKNRSYYCLQAIRQILSLKLPSVEICIQDNSDTDCLKKDIEAEGASNIVYNYHPGVLSFVDNFSEAISLANGEYVCMIGDDDGVLPNILKVVEYAKSKELDAIIPGLNAIYYWPSSKPIINRGEKGCLVLIPISQGYQTVNTKEALGKLVENSGINYLSFDLAKVYHGLVRRDIFTKIKEQTGRIFDGLTPDLYMATALSLTCNKVAKTDFPVTISGICPTSGSTDSATGKHTGELKDAPHFRGHDAYEWDSLVPAFYSVETIWTESMIKALRNFHQNKFTEQYSVGKFDSYCLKKYPQYANLIIEHAQRYDIDLFGMNNQGKLFKHSILGRIIRKIKRRFKSTVYLYEIKDISAAISRVSGEYGL